MASAEGEAARPACSAGEATLTVQVAFSPRALAVELVTLRLPAGSTVKDAIARAGFAAPAWGDAPPPGEEGAVAAAVWGRVCEPERVLCDGDRVELLRPLAVDPKDARRERQRGQGRAGGMPAPRRLPR